MNSGTSESWVVLPPIFEMQGKAAKVCKGMPWWCHCNPLFLQLHCPVFEVGWYLRTRRVKAAAKQLCPKKCVTEKNRANLVVAMPARVLKHPKDEMEKH